MSRAFNVVCAIHEGLWLGLLDRAALNDLTAVVYARGGSYHDVGHNTSGLFLWERSAVERHFAGSRRILVACGGAGREAIALAELGFEVTSFDCSAELAELAERLLSERRLHVRTLLAAPDEVPAGLADFDGLVIGWGGYSHIVDRERRVAFLRRLRSSARPNAPLLVSFLFDPGSRRFDISRAVANLVATFTRRRKLIERGDALTNGFTRYFGEAELRDELSAGGFETVELAAEPYSHAVARARLEG